MKALLLLSLITLLFLGCGQPVQAGAHLEAAARVASGKAVLVDVREPAEWAATGVAAPAILLSKSSFEAGNTEWKTFLDENRDKEIILMCRSGNRSGQLARILSQQGLRTTNLGGFSDWQAAGMQTRQVP